MQSISILKSFKKKPAPCLSPRISTGRSSKSILSDHFESQLLQRLEINRYAISHKGFLRS